MIHKIEHFCNYFADYKSSYALIGGAACTVWYAEQELPFRATADLDIVLIIESLDARFTEAFKSYIRQCGYRISNRVVLNENLPTRRVLYRFSHPTESAAPSQLELLSRREESLHLSASQHSAPLKAQNRYLGLSCILLDDAYYHFFRQHISLERNIPRSTIPALIVLKIKAYLNLSHEYDANSPHGSDGSLSNIRKHRNDVFFLLFDVYPERDMIELPATIRQDVINFLQEFSPGSPEWQGIFAHLAARRGKDATVGLTPEPLLEQLRELFNL